MSGRHGIRGRWSYHGEEATSRSYSISSSSASGTPSTAYTSSGSQISSSYLERAKAVGEDEQIQHIKSLVREFLGGDVRVPESWLTELGIGWVLHLPLADAVSAGQLGQTYDAPSWIRALAEIVEIIDLTAWLFPQQAVRKKRFGTNNPVNFKEEPDTGRAPDRASVSQLPNISEVEERAAVPDQLQFANFFQEAMFKMLSFVDWIVSEVLVVSRGIQPPYKNLSTMLGVHGALSKALSQIQLAFSSWPSAEVSRIQHDVVSLLAAKEVKAAGAIWSIMEDIRTGILEPMEDDGDDSSGTVILEGSSDIHKATRSLISYIGLLQANYSSLAPLVSVKYLSHNAAMRNLDSMIIEIGSCLEEKLAKESESFPDCSLRFLFLLNNSYYIWSVIEYNPMAANSISFLSGVQTHEANTTRKVRNYMESYLQASWSPVLSCLFNNPTPLCLGKNKNYSQLAKFESEFHKTYSTQKLWKVPDPFLRQFLRKAITKKIMTGYAKYIEDNNITTPRIALQEVMEEMLQALFEG